MPASFYIPTAENTNPQRNATRCSWEVTGFDCSANSHDRSTSNRKTQWLIGSVDFARSLFYVFGFWIFTCYGQAAPSESYRPKVGDAPLLGAEEKPAALKDVGITEHLGEQLNLDGLFIRDPQGIERPLREFISKDKPTIFTLVYFSCPGLCNLHLNGLFEAFKLMDWTVGDQFNLLAVSFDSAEKPETGAKKRDTYVKLYGRDVSADGMRFLTTTPEHSRALTEAVGFKYKWDDSSSQWAHGSAAIVITPDGHISRYLPGVYFEPQQIKLALTEAGKGQIGGLMDHLVLMCFKYDPKAGSYVIASYRIMQIGGALMILLLALVLVPFWLRQKRITAEKLGLSH